MFKSMKRIIKWAGKYKGRLYLGSVFSFFSSLSTAIPTMAAAYALEPGGAWRLLSLAAQGEARGGGRAVFADALASRLAKGNPCAGPAGLRRDNL